MSLTIVTNIENMPPVEVALKMDDRGFVSAKSLYEFLELDSEGGEQARAYCFLCEDKLKRAILSKESLDGVKKRWALEREKGIFTRNILTDTIKKKIPDSPRKKFLYTNYTNLVYQTVLGMSSKKMKELYGLKPKQNLRDYLTTEQLIEVEYLEMLIASFINIGMEYAEIKSFLQQRYTKAKPA